MTKPVPERQTLEFLYHEREMSLQEMSTILHADRHLIRNWLDRRGIPLRTHSETVRRGWKKGIWDGLSTAVKFRCYNCGREAKQMASVFHRSKHHYCGYSCRVEARLKSYRVITSIEAISSIVG